MPVFADEGQRRVVAVLDCDSPQVSGFGVEDSVGLTALAQLLTHAIRWQQLSQPVQLQRRSELAELMDASCATPGRH